ncbi:C3H1-type domain-containing protein [Entamoeba marina]
MSSDSLKLFDSFFDDDDTPFIGVNTILSMPEDLLSPVSEDNISNTLDLTHFNEHSSYASPLTFLSDNLHDLSPFDSFEKEPKTRPTYSLSVNSYKPKSMQTNSLNEGSFVHKNNKIGTKPCIFYMQNGYCKKGNDCTFSHDISLKPLTPTKQFISVDKLYRTKPCRYFFEYGCCRKGDHCNYSHDRSVCFIVGLILLWK